MSLSNYPLPRPNAHTQVYWDSCALGELRYQRCADCEHVQCIPRGVCERCQSSQLQWQVSQRAGTVLTFTTVHRAPLPAFKNLVPYVIAIVDLDEGFRVMVNALPDVQHGLLKIGARVRVGFTQVHGMAMPVLASFEETHQ